MADLVYSYAVYSYAADEGCDVQVFAQDDGSAEMIVYRPGAVTSRYRVVLPHAEVTRLALALAAHAHSRGSEGHR